MILDALATALHRERERQWASERCSREMVREYPGFELAFTGFGERLAERLRPAVRPFGRSVGVRR